MKAFIRFSISALSLFLILGTAQGMAAQDPALQDKISALADGSYSDRAKAIQAIAATGDARAVPALEALGEGLLFVTKSDKAIVIGWMRARRSRHLILYRATHWGQFPAVPLRRSR